MIVNILGEKWKIIESDPVKHPTLENCDGFCDHRVRLCVVDDCKRDVGKPTKLADLGWFVNKVKRHELIHAFLFESGLLENSPWAKNEEMVDWFATQFPKLLKAFQDAKCL